MYEVTYDMAIEVLKAYLKKIYVLDKNKGTSPIKVERIYELNDELRKLTAQLKADGHNVDLIIREIKEKLEQKYQYAKLNVFVDGAARGNNEPAKPNLSGIGYVIYGDSQLLHKEAQFLGSEISLPLLQHQSMGEEKEKSLATNNTAEYMALIEALEYMLENGLNAKKIEIFSDSRMVVTQVNMISATRASHLITLRDCALQLLNEFDNITLTLIPREKNMEADSLVNEMLDQVEEEQGKVHSV